MRYRFFFIFCLITLLLFPGCSWFQEKDVKSAPELAADGMEEYRQGNYSRAIENFEKLRDWYPFDRYAILAELKIADSHYQLKQYDEAVVAYQEFESLHPLNEAIPYVIYQIGLCYYEQLTTIDRDQSAARNALMIFERLQRQFPDHQYSKRAGEHIHTCLKSLAGHELYVGKFYFKKKNYKAALNRFKNIIYEFPDVGIHKEALDYMARCEVAMAGQ
jgi:outer membrane protein assembly factor BamD